MKFFIAREGEEIGEWPRAELDRRARAGELLPTDYYWTDGMEQWRLLGDLLAPELFGRSEAAPALAPPPAETEATTDPQPTSISKEEIAQSLQQLLARPAVRYGLAGAALLLLLVLVFSFWPRAGNVNPPILLDKSAAPAPGEPATEREDRDRAANDLRQRLEQLPARAAEPLNTFYFDLRVRMSRSPAARARWRAVITGSEHYVEAAEDKVVRQTLFTLTADYGDHGWVFSDYKAEVTNLETLETMVITHEPGDPLPSLATIIGLAPPPRY